jgi:hypothetical protein
MSDEYGFNPIAAIMLRGMDVVGPNRTYDEDTRPTTQQYAVQVGERVILAKTGSKMDQDIVFGVVLDPEEHKEDYPDFQDRLLRSYMLVRWRSTLDSRGDNGWFARARLIPITDDDNWDEVEKWFLTETFPERFPDWLNELYTSLTESLSEVNANIPKLVRCPGCDSMNVNLKAVHTAYIVGRAGKVTKDDGTESYTIFGEPEQSMNTEHRLICDDCGAFATLTEEEGGVDFHVARH